MTILITKQEVIRRFKEEVMPSIFVDSLIEEGLVNDNQYRNWCVPRFIEG